MHTIDAQGKKLGRIAGEAAAVLMGKNKTDFARNKVVGDKVKIINASKTEISEKKKGEKVYKSYSGFPGGQRIVGLDKLIVSKGYSEAIRKAVKGMLPKNKLQTPMLKNLTITE